MQILIPGGKVGYFLRLMDFTQEISPGGLILRFLLDCYRKYCHLYLVSSRQVNQVQLTIVNVLDFVLIPMLSYLRKRDTDVV